MDDQPHAHAVTAYTSAYTCECDAPERRRYVVVSHDGAVTECRYCDDCAALARVDWNGETKSIEPAVDVEERLRSLSLHAERCGDLVEYLQDARRRAEALGHVGRYGLLDGAISNVIDALRGGPVPTIPIVRTP